MMFRYALLLGCMLCTAYQALAQPAQTPAEKYVLQFAQRKNTWFTTNRADSVQWLLDSRCQYIHSNGWVQTAAEVVADMKSGKLQYTQISMKGLQARQYEKMVIVTGQGHFEGIMNGTAFGLDLALTEVYLNRKEGWKLVSRHASRLLPPQ